MKKIFIVLALAICFNAAVAQSQETTVSENKEATVALQNEFWGSILGKTSKHDVKAKLESRKLSSSEYGSSIILDAPTLDGLNYTYASMDFDEDVLSSVTFMKSGLSKEDAIVFSKAIYGNFADKYVMIKTHVDGFDCYFTNVGTTTCTIYITQTEYGYTTSVCYEYGTVKLKN